ncbi:MAG: DUF3307 domain-containing protein [Defluviimonas sp.]|uniref:DUF3307 domain-containing protein n=1 Tax=Albidovulum sp. TaxID=1872424 RepID=UPI001DCC6B8A|nr:DUF3307 domain-containing protein [Paracoccaceae bacterium]MCC0065337.1 DUF3307 domain-containing protein [Defluviimonas sp.]
MIQTLAALLFAHVFADFVLQTRFTAENKRRLPVLLMHGAIVLAMAEAALGRVDAWEVPALALLHIGTDWLKARFAPARSLGAFLADQGAHLAALAALAVWRPDLWAGGLWARLAGEGPLLAALPAAMALAAGLLIATRAGGFAVGFLMAPWAGGDLPKGLANGGKLIGILERGLIFVLVMVGQPAGIGFLVAAKSVLRFETTSKDQSAGEYVIIGTLASFGWALVAAYATRALIAALGFPPGDP